MYIILESSLLFYKRCITSFLFFSFGCFIYNHVRYVWYSETKKNKFNLYTKASFLFIMIFFGTNFFTV